MNETKNKHTPGPWRVMTYSSPEVVSGPDDGYKLVAMPTSLNLDQQVQARGRLADAHLIAAAPDLYSALVEFLDASNVPEIMTREETLRLIRAEDAARAAIKKARGEK